MLLSSLPKDIQIIIHKLVFNSVLDQLIVSTHSIWWHFHCIDYLEHNCGQHRCWYFLRMDYYNKGEWEFRSPSKC